MKLLHFAPEWVLKTRLANQRKIDYHTADLDSPLADEHFDITAIPYPDDDVDVIFCNHVLEHVPDDRTAMAELFRILKPGGWAIVMTPISKSRETTLEGLTDPRERLAQYGQEDHVRLYGQDFYARLRSVGFDVEVIDYVAMLPETVVRESRLRRSHPFFEDDKIIIARKPPRGL